MRLGLNSGWFVGRAAGVAQHGAEPGEHDAEVAIPAHEHPRRRRARRAPRRARPEPESRRHGMPQRLVQADHRVGPSARQLTVDDQRRRPVQRREAPVPPLAADSTAQPPRTSARRTSSRNVGCPRRRARSGGRSACRAASGARPGAARRRHVSPTAPDRQPRRRRAARILTSLAPSASGSAATTIATDTGAVHAALCRRPCRSAAPRTVGPRTRRQVQRIVTLSTTISADGASRAPGFARSTVACAH